MRTHGRGSGAEGNWPGGDVREFGSAHAGEGNVPASACGRRGDMIYVGVMRFIPFLADLGAARGVSIVVAPICLHRWPYARIRPPRPAMAACLPTSATIFATCATMQPRTCTPPARAPRHRQSVREQEARGENVSKEGRDEKAVRWHRSALALGAGADGDFTAGADPQAGGWEAWGWRTLHLVLAPCVCDKTPKPKLFFKL